MPPPSPLRCREAQSARHRRYLPVNFVKKVTSQDGTHGLPPQYCRWAVVVRAGHHRYRYILAMSSFPYITSSGDIPGGSILQIKRSLKSSLSRQITLSGALGGTTQVSPSTGKQSNIAFPNGRYGTSYSNSRLSCSASLLSTFPSERTKCPSGYRELTDQESIVTKIFWSMSWGAWRVRSRIRGRARERGVAKTVCWDREVRAAADKDDRSK